jgi:cytochrome c-type biogenesis protein CcmH
MFAGIAVVATLAVLAFVLRPLWQAPGTRVLGAVLVAACGVATLALYAAVGTPAALDPAARAAPPTLDAAIVQLRAQLKREPGSVEGWRLLGRAEASAGHAAKARDAYARAASLAANDPDVLVEAAESRALAESDRRFDAAAVALLRRALELQPTNQRGRWFLGIAQRQAGDAAGAARTWEPLLAEVNPGTATALREQVALARREGGLPPLPATPATPATTGHSVEVRVRLDPGLAARLRLDANARVFLVARAPGGSPIPVAVEKHAVAELPFTATLDDSDSLMPTQKLSALDEVELVARLSRNGDALPAEGDLQSPVVRVRFPAAQPVELVIGSGG